MVCGKMMDLCREQSRGVCEQPALHSCSPLKRFGNPDSSLHHILVAKQQKGAPYTAI